MRRRKRPLHARVEALCAEFPRDGYRRITHQLRAEGMVVNHKAVARFMRESGLQVRPLRRFVRTTDSNYDGPIFPNLARGFRPTGPNQLWVGDLTYIRIAAGFVYLAVILDAWSRRVIGYALGRQIDTRLALAALRAAIETRQPPHGCIHHSDRGVQYAAEPYRQKLAEHGLVGSMSRRGNPYDNGQAESFMKTIKCEEVYPSGLRERTISLGGGAEGKANRPVKVAGARVPIEEDIGRRSAGSGGRKLALREFGHRTRYGRHGTEKIRIPQIALLIEGDSSRAVDRLFGSIRCGDRS